MNTTIISVFCKNYNSRLEKLRFLRFLRKKGTQTSQFSFIEVDFADSNGLQIRGILLFRSQCGKIDATI